MNETSLTALFILLVGLIILSAFFSSSETGMMSLNRYRLKHMANKCKVHADVITLFRGQIAKNQIKLNLLPFLV